MNNNNKIDEMSLNILKTVKNNLEEEFKDPEIVDTGLMIISLLFMQLKELNFPLHNPIALEAMIQLGYALKTGIKEIEKMDNEGNN